MSRLNVRIVSGDVPQFFARAVEVSARAYLDIETTGLNYKKDKIGSIQLFDGASSVVVLRPPFAGMKVLNGILSNRSIKKVFHHAMFDLRFLRVGLGARAESICC